MRLIDFTTAVLVMSAATSLANAAAVVVGNASFETPNVVGTSPFFQEFAADTAGKFGVWEQDGDGTTFNAVYKLGQYGTNFTNQDGAQAATLTAKNNLGIFQDLTNYTTPDANSVWQEGQTYSFVAAIGIRSDSIVPNGRTMDMRMFWRPSDQGAANVVATKVITVGAAGGPTTGTLTDYTLTYTVPAGSPAIGKPIALWFPSTGAGTSGGDFVVDNVRLSYTPEPTSLITLAAVGTVATLRRRKLA